MTAETEWHDVLCPTRPMLADVLVSLLAQRCATQTSGKWHTAQRAWLDFVYISIS
jgi:hypothetical protein